MIHATAARPHAVAYDVLETILDTTPLRQRLPHIDQPPHLLDSWFLRLQRDALALALAGDGPDFTAVAAQALAVETGHTVTRAQTEYFLEAFADAPAHPDAAPALARLTSAGVRVGLLTVGTAANTTAFLHRTGLGEYVDQLVTCASTGTWKPAPAVYRATAHALGTPAHRTALVAVHAWDCHGARRAGCLAGWCRRLECRYSDVFTPATVAGDDLVAVTDALLALPEHPDDPDPGEPQ